MPNIPQQEDSPYSRGRPHLQSLPNPFVHRQLLDEDTFTDNFRNDNWPSRTYLCYEVEHPRQGSGIPPGQDKGVLRNKVTSLAGPQSHGLPILRCSG